MKKWGLVLLVVILGCSGEEKAPKGLIPKEKMADVLTDIHIAEARVSTLSLRSLDSSIMVFNRLEQQIWKKHAIDTSMYRASYNYYVGRPDDLNTIYKIVSQKIEKREKKKNIRF